MYRQAEMEGAFGTAKVGCVAGNRVSRSDAQPEGEGQRHELGCAMT